MSESLHVQVTCIVCPKSCLIRADKNENAELIITGHACDKGMAYAVQEITDPYRVITTTVRTTFPDFPRLPVKVSVEVPLRDVYLYMQAINRIVVKKRLKPGDSVVENLLHKGISLIATDNMNI